jgi:hypothetical protein
VKSEKGTVKHARLLAFVASTTPLSANADQLIGPCQSMQEVTSVCLVNFNLDTLLFVLVVALI